MDKRVGCRKASIDVQVKETRGDHDGKLYSLRELFKAYESEVLQECKKWLVSREQLCTRRDRKASRNYNVLSMVCRLLFDSSSDESGLKELMPKLQLQYEDSREVPVSIGPSLQVVDDDPFVQQLNSQVSMKEMEHAAAIAVTASSERKLDALKVQCAELDFAVTR